MTKDKRTFRVGMRNIKTTLAIMANMLLFALLAQFHEQTLVLVATEPQNPLYMFLVALTDRSNGIYACVAAVISMQYSIKESVTRSKARMVGTISGGVIGVLTVVFIEYLHMGNAKYILIPILIILIIAALNYFQVPDITSMALSMFLVSVVYTSSSADPVMYSINRVVATGIGVVTALIINRLISNPDKLPPEKQQEILKNYQLEHPAPPKFGEICPTCGAEKNIEHAHDPIIIEDLVVKGEIDNARKTRDTEFAGVDNRRSTS